MGGWEGGGSTWRRLSLPVVVGRAGGVPWDSDEGVELARTMHAHYAFEFEGVYAHDGQSYKARGAKEVGQLGIEAATRLDKLARRYHTRPARYAPARLSTHPPGPLYTRPARYTTYCID